MNASCRGWDGSFIILAASAAPLPEPDADARSPFAPSSPSIAPICANKRNTRRFVPHRRIIPNLLGILLPHPRHLAQSINCLHSPLHMTVIPLSPQRLQLTLHPLHTLYFGSLRRLLRLRTPGGKLTHDPRKRLLRHPQLPCLAAQHLHRLRIPHPLRQPFRSRRKKLFSGKLLIHAKGLPPCRHRRLIPQIIPHPGTRSRRTASAISTTAAAVSFSSIPVTVSGTISTSIISGTSHQAYRATAAICAPVTSLLAQKSIRNQFTNKHNI